VTFLDRELSPPICHITNHSGFLTALDDNRDQSLLLVQEVGSNITEGIIADIMDDFAYCPLRVFKLDYNEFNSSNISLFHHFGLTNQTVEFEGPFDPIAIRKFVDAFCFPAITRATKHFLTEMMKSDFFMLYYEDMYDRFQDNITQITKQLPTTLKTGVIDCIASPPFCYLLDLRIFGGAQLVLVRPKKNIHYKFDRELTDSNIYDWIISALNGKEPGFGKGAGFWGFFFNLKVSLRKRGLWPWPTFTAVAGLILIIVIVVVKCRNGTVSGGDDDQRHSKQE
jgi:hypothetical protein